MRVRIRGYRAPALPATTHSCRQWTPATRTFGASRVRCLPLGGLKHQRATAARDAHSPADVDGSLAVPVSAETLHVSKLRAGGGHAVPAQPCSQTQLATLLAIDASDMVRLIDSLEGHGWVTRDRDPKDRRRQIVTPTKKGTKAHAELAARVAAAEERALDASSQKQLKSLKKLSRAILGDAE